MSSHLRVITWNVYEGHKPDLVRKALRRMIRNQAPHVFALQEAVNQHGHLSGLGYRVIQLPPKVLHPGNRSETADTALLVRHDVPLLGRRVVPMHIPWKGPKHGLPHDPRVYRAARINVDDVEWNLLGLHGPFQRAAVNESVHAIRNWLRDGTGPRVSVGDWNMGARAVTRRVAQPVGAQVAGHRIDLAAFRGARLLDNTELPYHGSDHRAQRFDFAA